MTLQKISRSEYDANEMMALQAANAKAETKRWEEIAVQASKAHEPKKDSVFSYIAKFFAIIGIYATVCCFLGYFWYRSAA